MKVRREKNQQSALFKANFRFSVGEKILDCRYEKIFLSY